MGKHYDPIKPTYEYETLPDPGNDQHTSTEH